MPDPSSSVRLVVPLGEWRCSADPQVELVTYALGSCVGVTIYDPVVRVAGLFHGMLPSSRISLVGAPGRCIDVGLPAMIHQAYALGAEKRRLQVKLVGGACMLLESSALQVGPRNVRAVCELLERNGVTLAAKDIGGSISRTVRLLVGTGSVVVQSPELPTISL